MLTNNKYAHKFSSSNSRLVLGNSLKVLLKQNKVVSTYCQKCYYGRQES